RYLPRRIELPEGERAIAAAAGSKHTLILTDAGVAYGCGSNVKGQLGLGSQEGTSVPDSGNGLEGVTGIAAGLEFSLIMTGDGVFTMGDNFSGQLCTVAGTGQFTPNFLSDNDIKSFAAGASSAYFLLGDGTVRACGLNLSGQLGDGTNENSPTNGTFVQLEDISVVDVYAGPSALSAFLRAEDGKLYGTGSNDRGQLGVGDDSDRNVPTEVQFGDDEISTGAGASASSTHTLDW
ncbi:hypothetical protein ACHAWF_017056, partial [Thalassiosira exigua]